MESFPPGKDKEVTPALLGVVKSDKVIHNKKNMEVYNER
jgi:hypothetical protein